MKRKNALNKKKKNPKQGLEHRVSLVLLGKSPTVPKLLGGLPLFRIQEAHLWPLAGMRNPGDAQAHTGLEVASFTPFSSIQTPWVLLMEEGEELDPRGLDMLRELVSQEPSCVWELAVELMLEENVVSDFEWVTTSDLVGILGTKGKPYHQLEPRLFPQEALRMAWPKQTEAMERRIAPITIRKRTSDTNENSLRQKVSDLSLFVDGHFRHFDDTRFCPHFQWPWTSYLTMRYEHIPAVEKGILQGWGNSEMAAQALSYLIRFGHYSQAFELWKKIPKAWYENNPLLPQMAALAALASGRFSEAKQLLVDQKEIAGFSPSVKFNMAKMMLVLGRDEEALECLKDLVAQASSSGKEISEAKKLAFLIEANQKKRASFTLCILARDEEKFIENCISSIGGLAEEILVVDTGSKDRTKEIAISLGARVEEFPWGGDFSEARNFALEKATGQYVFMLDADEYISPEHLLNLHVLKALLPLKEPRAFRVPIAHIQTRHNWLVFVRAINPKLEKEAVRIFPRIDGVGYRGKIEEEIEPSLAEKGIPIANVAASDLTVFHDPFSRADRVRRKLKIYDTITQPDLKVALAAVGDHASAGDTEGLLRWLWLLHERFGQESVVLPFCLNLARFLEKVDVGRAESLYRELLGLPSAPPEALLGLAGLLTRSGRMDELQELDWEKAEGKELGAVQKTDLLSYKALVAVLEGDLEKASDMMESALGLNPVSLLAQAVKFLILLGVKELEGSLIALWDMAGVLQISLETREQGLECLVEMIERVSRGLLDRGLIAENRVLLAGAEILESILLSEVHKQGSASLGR